MHNMDEIIQGSGKTTPGYVYAIGVKPGDATDPTSLACDALVITEEEVEKAFKGMKKRKSCRRQHNGRPFKGDWGYCTLNAC